MNVFVDIGGVRAAEALVRLLPALAKSVGPRRIVVKCEALAERANEAAVVSKDATCHAAIAHPAPPPLPDWFWPNVCAEEVPNVRSRSTFKTSHVTAAAAPGSNRFSRYPLKYPPRWNRDGTEVCRFHNYAADGCLRLARGGCQLDHGTCHWCGEAGHRAVTCAAAAAAHDAALVDANLRPNAPPTRDPNDGTGYPTLNASNTMNALHTTMTDDSARDEPGESARSSGEGTSDDGTHSRGKEERSDRGRRSSEGRDGGGGTPPGVVADQPTQTRDTGGGGEDGASEEAYVYVAGGRNRGQTVGVTERFSLRRWRWERGPHIGAPRGSHGLAAARGTVYAVAGGGIRSNLDCAEALDVDQSADAASAPAWRPAGRVAEARHAVAACSTGDWGVYAVGGWANGNVCTGAVDFLDLRTASDSGGGTGTSDGADVRWTSLAPLTTPRKLHAAAGLPDGRLFVFGGRVSDEARVGPIASAEWYDPGEDAWRPAAALPFGACACAATLGGHVYVMTWGASSEGGGQGGGNLGGTERHTARAGGGR